MHLKQLKLAGFKSFVDPTIVPFSSQLVAVVGPNGCGKSNIIDAVRWVMGEASAKSLRGESMTDVIFNGSSNRKPVGLASVELVFDNSHGRLLGEYASYQEIAIKRVVTRDGESGYFLNGTRCRRRDITDLFLGTGAGTRGYSIIGQNTISQFVEAKPEELRAYFEEAAGVSKYKERRRETLQRIEKTRENLSRVDDICRELASQLQRLERQATVAQRYKALKIDERHYKRDILVIKYRNLTQEQAQTHIEMSRLSCLHEDHQASASNALKLHVMIEAQLSEAQESFQTLQSEYYQVGNEVARLQEMQQQQLREKQQVLKDQQQVKADIQLAEHQIQLDNEAYCLAEQALNDLQALLETHKQTFAEATQALHFQQTSVTKWDTARQELQQKVNYFQRETQVGQLNLQHSSQRKNDAMRRLEKIQMERLGFETTEGHEALIALQEQDRIAQSDYKIANDHLQNVSEQGRALNHELRASEQQLRLSQDSLQTLTMQHAAMEAAQQAVLHEVKTASSDLVSFCDHPRLLELISIEEPWRAACEWVLGESLRAVTLLDLDVLWPALEGLEGKSLAFVTSVIKSSEKSEPRPSGSGNPLANARGSDSSEDLMTAVTFSVESASFPRLLDKIEGFKPSWMYALDQVFTADNLEEAMRVQKILLPHQSVITTNGFWLGVGWLRIANFTIVDETSFLLRKKELSELQVTLDKASEEVSRLRIKRDGLHDNVAKNDREQNALKRAVADYHRFCVDVNARLNQKQQALQQAVIRSQALQEEQDELISCLETLALEQSNLEDALKDAVQQCQEHENQLQQVTLEQTEVQTLTLSCRTKVDDARSKVHSTELQCSREQLNVQQLSDAIQREQRRLDTLNERLLVLNQRYHNFDKSDIIPSDLLSQTILQHQQMDVVLTQTRHQVDELQLKLKDIHQSTLIASKLVKEVQDDLLKHQMAEQALTVRMSTLIESLTELETDVDIQVMLDELQPTMTLDLLSSRLIEIESNIKRLGAINLVAIEEYQIELDRKTHLDEQSHDLKDAIAMLESAIAKMDKETQARLKDTFERVNTLFQALFPRLFGGGQARLQLTCDNLLEAGVIVMAQPPGKRNSTIHLLSGGEKAMTAVALVFAIFQLNPSPFCMLDEVDAPLDDLNVGRFCDLVKEMSHYVQFLLISHNKVTMELAGHLIGVTMREPGVSRIVAVDVEQALSLTEQVA